MCLRNRQQNGAISQVDVVHVRCGTGLSHCIALSLERLRCVNQQAHPKVLQGLHAGNARTTSSIPPRHLDFYRLIGLAHAFLTRPHCRRCAPRNSMTITPCILR